MNLLLLEDSDRLDNGDYRIDGRRATHIRKVLKTEVGQTLRAGLLNAGRGRAELLGDDGEAMTVAFTETDPAPAPLPLRLILALPRPPMLRRLLLEATTLGIKDIVLLNSYRVEKSFWQTPELGSDKIREKLILGLEQAGDTVLPRVHLQTHFRPFVEDELPCFARDSRCLLAHPGDTPMAPADLTEPVTLAIGPEGGWIDYEVDWFREQGFECVSFGERILRVETAVTAMVGRVMRLA
jgi:16S rRNA (uracil1498-N3)-methyltransferase